MLSTQRFRALAARGASWKDGADEPVVDRYLLQLWPAPTMRLDAVLRQTSEFAAYWHNVA